MTNGIEFLKNEVARLRTEQILEQSPIRKLSIQKDIDEVLKVINAGKSINADLSDVNNSPSILEIDSMHNFTTDPANKEPPASISDGKPSNIIKPPMKRNVFSYLVAFYMRNWQWLWSSAFAVIGIYVAVLALN